MSLAGMQVNVVDAGTVVGKGPDGQEFAVTDESAVFNGPQMWVTAKVWTAMRAATPDAPASAELHGEFGRTA